MMKTRGAKKKRKKGEVLDVVVIDYLLSYSKSTMFSVCSVFIHFTEIHPQHKTLRDTVALFSHRIGGHFLSNRIL